MFRLMLCDSSKQVFLQKISKYVVGGLIAACVDLLILYLCTEYGGIQYLLSQTIAFIISFVVGFIFQKYITFQQQGGSVGLQGLLFLLFQLIGLGINLIILKGAVEYRGLHYLIGSIIAKGVVFVWNFVMNYYFNFKS